MKKIFLLAALSISVAAFTFLSCKQKKQTAEQLIAQTLIKEVDSFSQSCKVLLTETENKSA